MPVTVNKPIVETTVKVVEPATVTVTLSLHEALALAALQGVTSVEAPDTLYEAFKDHPLYGSYRDARGAPGLRLFGRAHQLDELRRAAETFVG